MQTVLEVPLEIHVEEGGGMCIVFLFIFFIFKTVMSESDFCISSFC